MLQHSSFHLRNLVDERYFAVSLVALPAHVQRRHAEARQEVV